MAAKNFTELQGVFLDSGLSILEGLGVVVPAFQTLSRESFLECRSDGCPGLAGAFTRVGIKGSATGRCDNLPVGS